MAMPARMCREQAGIRVFVRHRHANHRVGSDVRLKTRGDAGSRIAVHRRISLLTAGITFALGHSRGRCE
jgi:hypothetical protein